MCFSYVKRRPRVQSRPRLRGVVKGVEHGAGEASLETAQGFGGAVPGGEALVVVGLALPAEADLGDRDAVQGGVELAVAGLVQPDPATSVARPDRDRGHPGVHRVLGVRGAPVDPGGLTDDLGRSERPAAVQLEQLGGLRGDQAGDLPLQGDRPRRERLDVVAQLAGQPGIDPGHPGQRLAQPGAGLGPVQRGRRRIQARVDAVHVPAEPVDDRGALAHQILAMVHQQPELTRGLIVGGDRQIRLPQHRPGHRQRVDRVRLAPRAGGPPLLGHQLRRHRSREPRSKLALRGQP
jgi:hypothetical protein